MTDSSDDWTDFETDPGAGMCAGDCDNWVSSDAGEVVDGSWYCEECAKKRKREMAEAEQEGKRSSP